MRVACAILCGLMVVLMMCAVPVAAASVRSADRADTFTRPTVLIENGVGKDAGLVKVTNIHYAKAPGNGGSSGPNCYKLAGWKWSELPITYTVARDDRVHPDLYIPVSVAGEVWDTETGKEVFATPIRGDSTGYSSAVSDNKNSVSYGNYPTNGVIAVTWTWYSRATKTAVESDILFDTDFTWGDASRDPSLMDTQNIATHEIGHTLGLSDLYTKSCTDVTMYGYSTEGDVSKRDLALPDITGLHMLYGI
jgi:hypothetical protein